MTSQDHLIQTSYSNYIFAELIDIN